MKKKPLKISNRDRIDNQFGATGIDIDATTGNSIATVWYNKEIKLQKEHSELLAMDLVSAYNSTYAIGINPNSVKEMKEALEMVMDLIKRNDLVRDCSKDAEFNHFKEQGFRIVIALNKAKEAIKNSTL